MKSYPERHADGRTLLIERFDPSLASAVKEGASKPTLHLVEGAERPAGTLGVVQGTAAKVDIVNGNDRFYSRTAYALACERAKKLLDARVFLGEVDHPWMGSLQMAAARFTDVWLEGEYVHFKAVILETEAGQELRALLDGGVGVQVSTRGYASTSEKVMVVDGEERDVVVIGDDLTFEGIDFVLFASNPGGRVTKTESVNNAPVPSEKPTMNIETLRAEHPELVAQIEADARKGFIAESEVDTLLTQAREEALTASDLVTRVAVRDALRPLVGDIVQTEAAPTQELESLRTRIAELESTAQSEKARADEAAKAAARTSLEARVEALLKDQEYADLIRADLLACESVEAVNDLFEKKKTFIETVAARADVTGIPKGTGVADVTGDDGKGSFTPEQLEERRLAGRA